MARFLSAHGYDPGPTQRPLVAGALAGALASAPAVGLLLVTGALAVEARIVGTSLLGTIAIGVPVMAMAGAVYARLFGRPANDPRAGWLFGMAYGFVLWAAGAVLVLPLVSGGKAAAGTAALGVFLSLVVWGAALGALLPFLQRPLQEKLEAAAKRSRTGPTEALPQLGSRTPI